MTRRATFSPPLAAPSLISSYTSPSCNSINNISTLQPTVNDQKHTLLHTSLRRLSPITTTFTTQHNQAGYPRKNRVLCPHKSRTSSLSVSCAAFLALAVSSIWRGGSDGSIMRPIRRCWVREASPYGRLGVLQERRYRPVKEISARG
jgi:hypothetical protein